jgi:hypothetical protein
MAKRPDFDKKWLIARGITRTVIITPNYAIKLPSLRRYGAGLAGLLWSICRGILANQAEAEWWRNATEDQRPMLCPVLRHWLGGIINIYPRCDPYTATASMHTAMSSRDYRPLPELDPHPSDTKPENYGWLGRQLVVLDYDMHWNGCPHDRSGARNRAQEDATARMQAELDRANAELSEHHALLELQWTRMGAATQRWRAESPAERARVLPDLGELLDWLMAQADAAANENLGSASHQHEADRTCCC